MAETHKRLLDPAVLARLATLRLRARAIAEGVLSGLHKSPHRGQSVEFAEHKEYAPGDDVRRIDWKAYAKFDKFYVKQFEQETNLKAWLVVDGSGSMGYRGSAQGLSKLECASALAAALAHLLVRQGDAAGLLVVSDRVLTSLSPRAAAGHLPQLIEVLEGLSPAGPTRLAAAAEHLLEHASRRSSIMVFSDLLDREDNSLRQLAQLKRRKHEVTLFQVLDRDELEFPFEDPTLFLSMEDERQVEANGRDVRRGYLELLARWLADIRRAAAEADIEHVLCRSDQPLDQVLLPFLARRETRAA